MSLGDIENKTYEYRLYLAKPSKELITEIDYTDFNLTQNFRDYWELEFSVNYYENNNWQLTQDARFDLTKMLYYVLLEAYNGDTLSFQHWFAIDNPQTEYNDGMVKKNIHCLSSHYMIFNKRILRSYNQVNLLYNSATPTDPTQGILNYMMNELYHTWTVDMDSSFIGIYHTFNYSSSTYTDVFHDIELQYNCFVIIDNINNIIHIEPTTYGEDSGLILSNSNYIKNVSSEDKGNEIITRLRIYGKDNLSINSVNPIGQSYKDNFDYFLDNGYFSDGLTTSYNTYKVLLITKESEFSGYLNDLNNYNAQLLTAQNEKADLIIERKVIEDDMDSEKNNSYSTTATYTSLLSDYNSKVSEISAKDLEIINLQNLIDGVNLNISTLQNEIAYENNFSSEELLELSNYICESDLTLSQIDDVNSLYTYAQAYIIKKSVPTIDIEIDLIDIYSSKECQLDWDKIELGNYVYIDCEELGYNYYQTRIVRIFHNPYTNSINITLSNLDKINSELYYLKDLIKPGNQAKSDIDVNKDSYSSYTNEKDTIIFTGDTIDTDDNEIEAGDVVINRRGFIGEDIGSSGKIQILKDKIIISDDGFDTYHTLLSGNGLYLEKSDGKARIVINPTYGIQIDKKVGVNWENSVYIDSNGDAVFSGNVTSSTITGGTITIGSGDNVFKADSNGIYLGNSIFADAPFSVSMSGAVEASNITITGGSITGGTINIGTDATIGSKLYIQTNTFNDGIYFDTLAPETSITVDPGGLLYITPAIDTGDIDCNDIYCDDIDCNSIYVSNGSTGSFTSLDSKTITVENGIITNIV